MMEKTDQAAATLAANNNSRAPAGSDKETDSPGSAVEEREEPCWSADSSDSQLMRCMEILKEIHVRYYPVSGDGVSSKRKRPDAYAATEQSTASILSDLKGDILSGCCIAFSCVFPNNFDAEKIERQPLWRQAKDLGATVEHSISAYTTHLITMQPATAKAKMCFSMKSVHVVHPDWLLDCVWNIKRAEEAQFYMGPAPTSNPAPIPAECTNQDSPKKRCKGEEAEGNADEACPDSIVGGGASGIDSASESESGDDDDWMKNMENELGM